MKEFKKTIGFISLGCDKNRVDTENMITKFARPEFEIVSDETKANIIIINTCAFIEMAKRLNINDKAFSILHFFTWK